MTQTTNENKKSRNKPHATSTPTTTLIFLCGTGSSPIRKSLLDELSSSCFVRTNGDEHSSFISKTFTDNCYAVTHSSVFIFIIDNQSVFDVNCLSLLGTAISFDIPVIGVREIGYAMPCQLPQIHTSTEIVDRSKTFECIDTTNNKRLPSVTTLASALKVLFTQSIIFHEQIKKKCARGIVEMLRGCVTRVTARRFGIEEQYEEAPNRLKVENATNVSHELEIRQWPCEDGIEDADQRATKFNGYRRQKSPELRKPLTPSPPTTKQELTRRNNRNTNTNSLSKLKINVHSPNGHISGQEEAALRTEKDSQQLLQKEQPKKLRSSTVVEHIPNYKLRRLSSLPCINTNYMVMHAEERNSQPKIYRFPLSPRLDGKGGKRVSISSDNFLDENDDKVHLSRACSPIDFRLDEDALSTG